MKNTFDKGQEGWCSYDYHGSVTGGKNIFIMTTHERSGGINDSGYVWCDEHRWSADTPEAPVSILPLIYYRTWTDDDPVDLRGAKVSVYLRGDNLDLYGADCLFWVHSHGTRWHFNSNPLEISDGKWSDRPNTLTLKNDESLWHMSWTGRSEGPASLDALLKGAVSYGFSFVGVTDEARGRLSMDEFEIRLASK